MSTNDIIRDDYHTMQELYGHRNYLFTAFLLSTYLPIYKKPVEDGWFIAGVLLPTGQCAYHLPEEINHLIIPTIDAPEWDGFSPEEGLDRLKSYLETLSRVRVRPPLQFDDSDEY